jgi:signal transduction histidine kinase
MLVSMLRYQSLRLTNRHSSLSFSAGMKTASSGMKVFSHSIKNQFVTIRLISEHLLVQQDLGPEERRESIENIRSICDKGVAKLNSLPLWQNRLPLRYSLEDVVPLLWDCVREFPGLSLRIGPPEIILRVDLACFQEVLHNLLVNSREACDGLEKAEIVLAAEKQFRYYLLSVEDNGCGMDSETLRHAFDPFYSSKPTISNWGLGLPYCKQVVEAFGGAIAIDSAPGRGTKVTLYLPEASHGN